MIGSWSDKRTMSFIWYLHCLIYRCGKSASSSTVLRFLHMSTIKVPGHVILIPGLANVVIGDSVHVHRIVRRVDDLHVKRGRMAEVKGLTNCHRSCAWRKMS